MHFSAGRYEVSVFDHVAEAGDRWNDFHSRRQHLHSGYLEALESARPADMEFRYVLISAEEKTVAAAYLQLVNYSDQNFSGHASWLLLAALKLFFRLKKVRLLFCGNLFRVDFPCLHYQKAEIKLKNVLDILDQVRAVEKCQLLMLKEKVADDEEQEELFSHGFRCYEEDFTMAIQLTDSWKTFDDYRDSLKKKYRQRLRKIRKAKEKIVVKQLSPEEVKENIERIRELFVQTAEKQFLKMGIIDEKYFLVMQNALGADFFINGYFSGQRLVSFASHIVSGEMLEVHYIGIDYAGNQEYSLYFNILYDGLEKAIGMRKKVLELGRTAREAKASLGCEPMPSHDYLYVANPFVNFLIRLFENIFLRKMGDEWKRRYPFKS